MNTQSFNSTLTAFLLILSILVTSCQDPTKSDNPVLADQKIIDKAPISYTEYHTVVSARHHVYAIKNDNGNWFVPIFNDPVVLISDLMKYKDRAPGKQGIRIYPGLTTKNSIVPIIALANDGEVSDTLPVPLIYGDYTGGSFHEGDVQVGVDLLRENFQNKVFILGRPQAAPDANDTITKRFRYYTWSQINSLIEYNVSGLKPTEVLSIEGFRMKFESGYVPEEYIDRFHNRNPVDNEPRYQQGFTAVLSVLDSKANSTIDPMAAYDPNNPQNYRGLYLEVGLPCPPRCASDEE